MGGVNGPCLREPPVLLNASMNLFLFRMVGDLRETIMIRSPEIHAHSWCSVVIRLAKATSWATLSGMRVLSCRVRVWKRVKHNGVKCILDTRE